MSEHFPGNAPSPAVCCHEIANFVDILKLVKPPRLGLRKGDVELYGNSVFLNGAAGGDHIIYVDFEHRYDLERRIDTALAEGRPETAEALAINRDRIGILVADVSGHKMTDALAAAMLHQAFLTGVLYELDRYGEVTTRLFENLNARFHNSLSFQKYITLIYGEISSNGGFRFLSAGSPPPLVFSAEYDRFVTICPDRTVSFLPLGMAPSEDDVDLSRHLGPLGTKPRYTVNEVNLLGDNDILILHTDGLSELSQDGGASFVAEELEKVIRRAKRLPAEQIYMAIREAATEFAPIEDDMTLLVIKKRKDGG